MTRLEIIDYIKAYISKLTFGSTATYETIPETADLIDNDIPSWKNVQEYAAPADKVVLTAAINDASLKVLSAGDLASVNALNKLPDMVVTGLRSGSQYTTFGYQDITYDYQGVVGNFTYFAVNLHDDGTGHTPDAVTIQLS